MWCSVIIRCSIRLSVPCGSYSVGCKALASLLIVQLLSHQNVATVILSKFMPLIVCSYTATFNNIYYIMF